MKENLVIFLIVLLLLVAIIIVGYVIFMLRNRMRLARTGGEPTTTGSDTSTNV
jgi:flagellar basal body-associated protein FliL